MIVSDTSINPWPDQKEVYARFYQKSVNLRDFSAELDPKIKVLSLKQVHSSDVITVGEEKLPPMLQADAMVTKLENMALTIHTADCLPLLAFANGVIGSCHAGWRGLSKNIVEGWIARMQAQGATRDKIKVAIGPSIGPCHFEVGADVARDLVHGIPEKLQPTIQLKHPNSNKSHVDLRELARYRLMRLGISEENIYISKECTFCDREKYHSFRRDGDKNGQRLEAIIVKGNH